MKNKVKVRILTLLVLLSCLIIGFTAGGCSNDRSGTYIPDSSQMKQNLESKNYSVSVVELDGNYGGTHLIARNGNDEYIEFYWLSDSEYVEYFFNLLETEYGDFNRLVSFEDDEKYGNVVFCGTDAAVDDAGIVIVKVKV